MRALSIRQPWAHAILHLGKRVENRDWKGCAYRGPVLLHASKTLVLRDFDEEIESVLDIVKPEPGAMRTKMLDGLAVLTPRAMPKTGALRGCTEVLWRPAPTLPLGGIVGRAQIVGVLHANAGNMARDWYGGGFALVLADVEPLPFIPYKGSLGFFEVPDKVVDEAIRKQAEIDAKIRKVLAEHGSLELASRVLLEAPPEVQRRYEALFDRQREADDAYDTARALALDGNRERAMEWLKKAVQELKDTGKI